MPSVHSNSDFTEQKWVNADRSDSQTLPDSHSVMESLLRSND